jgi:hypothetical protein
MKKNMGTIDRAIRAVVGIAAITAYFVGWLTGTLAIISLVVGIVLLGTAAIRWCPPYDLLGINTDSRAND